VLRAMALVNLAAGAAFGLLSRRGGRAVAPPAGQPGTATVAGFAIYAWVAGLVGFAMLTLQTVLIRLGGLSLGSSQFTFSLVVAVFVLCIALGSLMVSCTAHLRFGCCREQWLLAVYLGSCTRDGGRSYATLRSPRAATAMGCSSGDSPRYCADRPAGMMSAPASNDHLCYEAVDLGASAGQLEYRRLVGALLAATCLSSGSISGRSASRSARSSLQRDARAAGFAASTCPVPVPPVLALACRSRGRP
jgi:hypothetical protein